MNVSGERKSCISDGWGSKGILSVVFLAGTMSLQGCVELNSRPYASGPPCQGHVLGDIQVLTWYLHATTTSRGFLVSHCRIHWNGVVFRCATWRAWREENVSGATNLVGVWSTRSEYRAASYSMPWLLTLELTKG